MKKVDYNELRNIDAGAFCIGKKFEDAYTFGYYTVDCEGFCLCLLIEEAGIEFVLRIPNVIFIRKTFTDGIFGKFVYFGE